MFVKLENENLIYAPKELIINDTRVINPTKEMFEEAGYKELIETEYPNDGKHYKASYQETDGNIVLVWIDNEKEYWDNIDYEEAVNNEIRKKYSESQEFALLRQKDEKPEEYQKYYDYCEECKAYIKSKKEMEVR